MIGNDVAHGLAWSHYCGYLQHVLPVIEESIEQTDWYTNLSKEERKQIPKKLYELIPRKCYVDIPGSDENIEKVSDIAIEGDRAESEDKLSRVLLKAVKEDLNVDSPERTSQKGFPSEKSWFEPKGSKSKTLMSYKVVASLKGILESRKVQTVAIVNESDELHIYDDLRWVACIPFHNNENNLIETLNKVTSGNEVKLENSTDLYLKPGEAAVGLAWGFAVNYLNKVLPDTPGTDENIEKVSDLAIEGDRAGNKRNIKLQIYSIKDGKRKYYCVCECPPVLNTINNMNDIQTAGITHPTGSNIFFPLRRHPKLQLFTIDTKLVQLMRFYYAMNALLCLKKENKVKARFLLFNESEEKLSRVLLKAIKEDLNVDRSEQKLHSSLMEHKLQSGEENKDAFYQFDIVVNSRKIQERKHFVREILLVKGLVGKDEIRCNEMPLYCYFRQAKRVFLSEKNWFEPKWYKSKTLMSYKVVASLKGILESRKVQTVAIVNECDELHIYDDLRWVACIPLHNNETNLIETLYKVTSEEAAVGLASGFAVNYLKKILPGVLITK
ncbi:MITA [Mytilus edulis]|uniref:TMEM173 n=1 Tax=Mytilus edulis TaxID=6550 RepID=A0A8S3UMH5_MYTED|nr:MITA [Mytilus edulis]